MGVPSSLWRTEIGQSDVSGDAEAAVVSRQVAKNGFQPFVPDDSVLLADRVARGGGTRRGGAALQPVLTDPFVEIMHRAEYRECFGITTCELGWRVAWVGIPPALPALGNGRVGPRSQVVQFGHRLASGEIGPKHSGQIAGSLLRGRWADPGHERVHRLDDEEKDDEGDDQERDKGVEERLRSGLRCY